MRDFYTNYPRSILWLIRGGSIIIGGGASDAEPAFEAEVDSFYLGKFPVSNLQYEAFDPSYRRSPRSPSDSYPAIGISFEQAQAYCRWYADVSRKKIRLPSEVEWEYACRAESSSPCFFEDPREAGQYLWDRRNSQGQLQPLDQKRPNAFGLYGMLGGVWEWTDSSLPSDAGLKVLRGGSWQMDRDQINCSVRRAEPPDVPIEEAGFRIARSFRE